MEKTFLENDITKDALGMDLYFSSGKIFSAGEDRYVGTKDDINNKDNSNTILKPYRIIKAIGVLLFFISSSFITIRVILIFFFKINFLFF